MWLWLIQRDLECIYTFANVPAALLYYSNFYCKNRLSAIWWSHDFWGITCRYCYNWYPLQAWEKIWPRLLEGFLLYNSRKCTFCSSFTVEVSIIYTTSIPMEPLVYSVSSSQKAKMLIFCIITTNNELYELYH